MIRPRLLFTGANGFVGRQVLPALTNDFDLHFVSRSGRGAEAGNWHKVDLRNPQATAQLVYHIKPTHLIHLAWNTEHGTFWHAEDNLEWRDAGVALVRAFAESGGQRLLITGTGAEYDADATSPISENIAAQNPATLYGKAKRDLFLAASEIAAKHNISIVWPRIFNTYGAGEPVGRLVPSIINSLLDGKTAKCSSGTQQRDFVDSRDLGHAIAALISSDISGAINLGSGDQTTIGQIARMIGELMGRPELIALGALPDREGEPQVHIPDLTRMREELKYTPKINYKRGIQEAIGWWREYPRG